MFSCKSCIICKNNANDVFVQTKHEIYSRLLDDCRKSIKFGLVYFSLYIL